MIDQGKMTKAGSMKIKAAKENGKWYEANDAKKEFVLSEEFLELLSVDTKAKKSFDKQSPSQKKNYIQWIMSAKKPETQERRLMKMIGILKDSEKKPLNY